MSRIFELLQRAAKEQQSETLTVAIQDHTTAPAEPGLAAVDTAASTKELVLPELLDLNLEMDEVSREEIAKLVQRVFLLPGSSRALVFAAVESTSGCTWMLARAALILASHATRPVCMVDANFRSPALHSMFSVENHYGLTDALAQPGPIRKFIRHLGPNLWLLSCGSMASNGKSLLKSDLIRGRIAELREEFQYILIDAPPISSFCSDVIAMGRLADGVALVVEANSTRRELARKAVQDLSSGGVRLAGAVLNKRSFPIPEALYKKL
jgi:Mrp family chromosome partitioning ATPase